MIQLQTTIKFTCNKSITVNTEKDNYNAIITDFFFSNKTRLFSRQIINVFPIFLKEEIKHKPQWKFMEYWENLKQALQLKHTKMTDMRSITLLW